MAAQSYIKLKGYQTYHNIHPDNQAKGRSAVIIKESISHYEEQLLQSTTIEVTKVRIKRTKQNLIVGAVYCPPRHNLKSEDHKIIRQYPGERFIIGGDFNAKHTDWISRLTTTKGNELREAIGRVGGNYHSTGKPTHRPTDRQKIPELLDFIVSRKVL